MSDCGCRSHGGDSHAVGPTMRAFYCLTVVTAVLAGYVAGNVLPLSRPTAPALASAPESPVATSVATSGEAKRPASSNTIPGPWSDEEIATMSRSEAQATLGELSRARQIPTLDDATKSRLKTDFMRVLARAKVAQ